MASLSSLLSLCSRFHNCLVNTEYDCVTDAQVDMQTDVVESRT